MNITLIRHGSVDENYLGCYNGHIDIDLSEQGIINTKKLKYKIDIKEYDAIYSSNLKRARQTAQALNLKNVTYTKELQEKSWGENEGKTFEEIGIKYEGFLNYIEALGGESINEFRLRIENFFYNYLPKQKKDNILIITHSGVIKTLISLHENISLESAFSKNIEYSSITRIKLENF